MKHLVLALALATGGPAWRENTTERLSGFVCPTESAVERVSSVQIGYSLLSTLESANCLFMVFEGTRVSESPVFGVGNTLYAFSTINVEGHRVYLLEERGDGFLA